MKSGLNFTLTSDLGCKVRFFTARLDATPVRLSAAPSILAPPRPQPFHDLNRFSEKQYFLPKPGA